MGCAASNPATHDTEGRGRPQRPQAQASDEPTALAHGLNKYVEVEALLELLAEEDIVLVWASSLMRLAKSGGRFLRRQDLPAGAAVDQALSAVQRSWRPLHRLGSYSSAGTGYWLPTCLAVSRV